MKLVSIIILIMLLTSGCAERQEEILVKIDNKVITNKDFEKRIATLPPRYHEVINKNKRKFLDEIIIDELLYKEALRSGILREKEVKEIIEAAKKKILIAKLLKEKIDDEATVEESDLKEYYQAHQEEFKTPEVLRASHILVKTEKEANDILLELANNRNFEDLARARSIDPSSVKGGDIGYFTMGQLDPDFEKVCFQLEEDEISDVVKTRFGYHIIKLIERKPPSIASYEEVESSIKQKLITDMRRKRFNELVERLKDRSKIEINETSKILTISDEEK